MSFKLNATAKVINFPSPWHVSTRSDLQKYLVTEAEVKGSESCILNRLWRQWFWKTPPSNLRTGSSKNSAEIWFLKKQLKKKTHRSNLLYSYSAFYPVHALQAPLLWNQGALQRKYHDAGQEVSLHHKSQKQRTSSSAFPQGRDCGCRAGFLKVSGAWSKTSNVLESIPELCINMFHCQDPCISFQPENWLVNSHLQDTYCSRTSIPLGICLQWSTAQKTG